MALARVARVGATAVRVGCRVRCVNLRNWRFERLNAEVAAVFGAGGGVSRLPKTLSSERRAQNEEEQDRDECFCDAHV